MTRANSETWGREQILRIALTCSGLSHVRRGVETWSQETFEALRERGVDATLFQGSGLPAPPQNLGGAQAGPNGAAGVHVVGCLRRDAGVTRVLNRLLPRGGWRLGIGSPYQTEQTTFALKAFWPIRNHFDLLHTKDPQVALLLHAAHRLGVSRPKVIFNHGTEEPAEFLRRFDYIQHLAPSHLEEALRDDVRARAQFVVPNFVDTGRFSPGSGSALRQDLHIPEQAFVIACVAAVKRHHKRLDWLLQEVATLRQRRHTDVYLIIAGSRTDDTATIIRLGADLLGERVRFLVDRPHEQMPSVYRAADLFVLCSLKEMLSNALLEALASGVPCVASAHPVNRWAIGEGGKFVDMERPGLLADVMAKYVAPVARRQASERARAQALRMFATDVVLAQQLEMYQHVFKDPQS